MAAVPPLEDEDMLAEILLRLPPEPSSLPRASAVCRRWRRLVSDACFIRRFRRHHRRNPPLLGFFNVYRGISFQPTLKAPNRVPPGRFSLPPLDDVDGFRILNTCHGLVLLLHQKRGRVLVWDPVTGDQHSFATPTAAGFGMNESHIKGAVLRAAGEVDHFQVVLVVADQDDKQHALLVVACVYSSEIGVWGDPISISLPSEAYKDICLCTVWMPAVLVKDSIYWTLYRNCTSPSYILEFDLERQRLAMIELPVGVFEDHGYLTPVRAEGGGLGFIFVSRSDFSAQLWKRKIDCHGVASWVLGRTIELDKLLSMGSEKEEKFLDSLHFKKIIRTTNFCYPFESVYAVPAIS